MLRRSVPYNHQPSCRCKPELQVQLCKPPLYVHLSQERLADLQKELAELRDEFNTKKVQWDNEKKSVEKVQKLREEIEQVKNEIKTAQQNYDLEKAAELQYGRLPQLQKELDAEEEAVKNKDLSLVHENVSEEEIARIISRWTGIPVAKLTESERNKTLHLDEELHKRVIGQDEGVTKVTEAIIRSKAGIKDPSKPIGSFLFLGPTGVGKTELAKALAASLFDDESNMVRLDMSAFFDVGIQRARMDDKCAFMGSKVVVYVT